MTDESTPNWRDQYIQSDPPEFLYHYTTLSGLIGIAENAGLWATHSRFLNDASEYLLTFHLAEEYLRTVIVEQSKKDSIRGRMARRLLGRLTPSLPMGTFVACFCSNRDLLSQWRGYSSGEAGYSIGFKSEVLREIVTKLQTTKHAHLGRCLYSREKQKEAVQRVVSYHLSPDFLGWEVGDLCQILSPELIKVGAFFKDASFNEEDEWRIFVVEHRDHQRIHFRRAQSTIVPYTEIPLIASGGSAVDNICIGPCPDPSLSRISVEMLLHKHFMKHSFSITHSFKIDISESAVPYRHW